MVGDKGGEVRDSLLGMVVPTLVESGKLKVLVDVGVTDSTRLGDKVLKTTVLVDTVFTGSWLALSFSKSPLIGDPDLLLGG